MSKTHWNFWSWFFMNPYEVHWALSIMPHCCLRLPANKIILRTTGYRRFYTLTALFYCRFCLSGIYFVESSLTCVVWRFCDMRFASLFLSLFGGFCVWSSHCTFWSLVWGSTLRSKTLALPWLGASCGPQLTSELFSLWCSPILRSGSFCACVSL